MKHASACAWTAVALCVLSSAALAKQNNVAPAPPAVPVGEVGQQSLAPVGGQTIEGTARVIDGDELWIGDHLVRLYGIAAPDMGANLGPDARILLDRLADGQRVACREVDRAQDKVSIAICSVGSTDLAPELLSQGMAAVYRTGAPGSPAELELAARYDNAEADARTHKRGVWAPRDTAPPAPPPPPQPTLIQSALPKWIEQAPLLGLIALLGIGVLGLLARRRSGSAQDHAINETALVATLLAEVSAIRESAQEQYDGTSILKQELPIPSTHQGLLSVPRATVFGANANHLDLLPSKLAGSLIRFYAMHDGVAHLLGQAAHVPCHTVRAALERLTRSADEVLSAR
jgi:endonuclease YncB( thermonuclease family)